MIEATGITLREAIEAILIVFIMAAYVERIGESWKKKYIYYGALTAVAVSAIFAAILSMIGINPENEFVEGVMFFVAAVLVASLVVWMWRKSKVIKAEIENKVQKASGILSLASIAFFMVFREGVETVIFLQSLILAGEKPVENFLGALMGILLAIVFGYVFLRGTTRINLSRFFRVTSLVLGILVVELVAGGFHEFFEVGILPTNDTLMLVVGTLVRDDISALIIVLMLSALTASVIYDVVKFKMPETTNLKPAEKRKIEYELLKEKYYKTGVGIAVLTAIALIFYPVITAADLYDPEPVEVEAKDGVIKIQVPDEEGFYKYKYKDVRIQLVSKTGQVFIALDDCYICPPKGYAWDGEFLVCINCNAPIEPETVGLPGGCNPVAINYSIEGRYVLIEEREVDEKWQI